jgi:phosphate transport system substrate-binding protein
VSLTGSGATFPALLYQKWFQEYQGKTGVQINYQAIGSGGGIKEITSHIVDFGASDAPMTDNEVAAAPGILHVPTVAGAVVLAYNLPGAGTNLRLTGDTIANIFLGKITKWNDPAIAASNPGVKLPNTSIHPFHRSDGSGTTNIFTNYLNEISPAWKTIGAGKSVSWPLGDGGKGNPGVAALVQQNEGGIGYIELAFAVKNKIDYAEVQNAKGKFIVPSVDSTTAAANGVTLPPDFRKVITNTTAPDGYPITGFTFILVYKDAKPEVKQLLTWALSDGQKDAAPMFYAPLPESVRKQAIAEIDTIK